jgi:hypothetical protein
MIQREPASSRQDGKSIGPDKLRNNLHAILTISDRFLPHAGLEDATKKIYMDAGESGL